METRKVQITGKSTYIISLPKTWVKKVNITNGNSVAMLPRSDGTLLLNPIIDKKDDQEPPSIIIEANDVDTLFRKFIASYLSGFNIIEIINKDHFNTDMRQKVRFLTHNVIGLEIIDETSTSIKIKDLLDSSDLSPKQVLKRMYMITRGMHRDAIDALQQQNFSLAEDVTTRDDDVDKFYWLIAKQYNLILNDMFFADKMHIKPKEILGYLLVARSIERIADHAKKIAINAKNVNINHKSIDNIVRLSNKILKLFDNAIAAFHRDKFEYANEVITEAQSLSKQINDLKQEIFSFQTEPVIVGSLAYIVDSLERTRAYIMDIAETSINHQYSMKLSE